MKMAVLMGALLLAGCAASPEAKVFALRSAYDATILMPAARYASMPPCVAGKPLCSEPKVVDALRKADLAAEATLDAAETVVRNNKEVDAAAAISAAENAIAATVKILTIYGVK